LIVPVEFLNGREKQQQQFLRISFLLEGLMNQSENIKEEALLLPHFTKFKLSPLTNNISSVGLLGMIGIVRGPS